jgi:4-amino-4-deoxychorismate lyase
MCRLVESVRVSNGAALNVEYHLERMNRSRRELFGARGDIDPLSSLAIPEEYRAGIVKCRLLYRAELEAVEFHHYRVKPAGSVRLVYDDTVDYTYKYEDREALDRLFGMRGECDEIIIVRRGVLTDASSANIVLDDGSRLITPDTPLLRGTMRARLLDRGIIAEGRITPDGLRSFARVHFINAFADIGDRTAEIDRIVMG